MNGLVVQTGAYDKSSFRSRYLGGISVQNKIIDPSQLSGFSYDKGFTKSYGVPSVVFKRMKEPTQKIPKQKKVNYLKLIAETLQEQKELVKRQAGYGTPVPILPPQPQEFPPSLLGATPSSEGPFNPEDYDSDIYRRVATLTPENVPAESGGFFNSVYKFLPSLFMPPQQELEERIGNLKPPEMKEVKKIERPQFSPPTQKELENKLKSLRPSPKGLQPAIEPEVKDISTQLQEQKTRLKPPMINTTGLSQNTFNALNRIPDEVLSNNVVEPRINDITPLSTPPSIDFKLMGAAWHLAQEEAQAKAEEANNNDDISPIGSPPDLRLLNALAAAYENSASTLLDTMNKLKKESPQSMDLDSPTDMEISPQSVKSMDTDTARDIVSNAPMPRNVNGEESPRTKKAREKVAKKNAERKRRRK